jgi:hypothetical protein
MSLSPPQSWRRLHKKSLAAAAAKQTIGFYVL